MRKNTSIQLIRIISMFCIVLIHIINNGGILHNLEQNTIKYYIILLLYIICLSFLNIFAIMSGYLFADKKKIRSRNIISIILTMVFWSILITFIFYIFNFFNIRSLGIRYFVKGLMPFMFGRYWYITSYTVLFFSIPFINIIIHNIRKEEFEKILIIFFIFFCIIPTISVYSDVFCLNKGYSFIWLTYCYFIGAYIKLYKESFVFKKKDTFILVFTILITLMLNILTSNFGNYVLKTQKLNDTFRTYNSPFIIIISLYIFLALKNINVKTRKVLNVLSDSTFGVYVIHSHIFIFDLIIRNSLEYLCKCNVIRIIIMLILYSLIIFFICIIIETIRIQLFKFFKIDKVTNQLGEKLDMKISIKN